MKLASLFAALFCSAVTGPAFAVSLQPTATARLIAIHCNHTNEDTPDETYFLKNTEKFGPWDFEAKTTVNAKNFKDQWGFELFSAHRGEVHFGLWEDDTDIIDPDDKLGETTLMFDAGKFIGLKDTTKVGLSDKGSNGGIRTIVLHCFGEKASYDVTIEIEEELAGINVCVQLMRREGSWKYTQNEPPADLDDELQILCARQVILDGNTQNAGKAITLPNSFSHYHLVTGLEWVGIDNSSLPPPTIGYGTLTETRQLRLNVDFREIDESPGDPLDQIGSFNIELRLVKTTAGYEVEHTWKALQTAEFQVPGGAFAPEVKLLGTGQQAFINMTGSQVKYPFLGSIYIRTTDECKDE